METQKKAVPNPSIGVDGEQSICKTNQIITKNQGQDNEKATINGEIIKKKEGKRELETLSMDELYDSIYAPKRPIVDGLLYNGTYLFVGAPKVGKSFFMAQLGYHVSKGIPLWGFQIEAGEVLYLALEDDFSRLQKRLSRMFGAESSENFHFATQSLNLTEGLEEQLLLFVNQRKDVRLIIIDTLQKVREIGGDKVSYGNDYDIVTRLKRFSDKHNICLLVVHHTRKMESSDSFDMISGTNGLLGAADGAFIMQKKKRTENKAILEVVGRDQQDQRIKLNFNREQCIWELGKIETELWKEPPDPILEAIEAIVTAESPVWEGTATQLLAQMGDMGLQPNILTRKLNISMERLLLEKKIQYESKRTHSGRTIKLMRLS